MPTLHGAGETIAPAVAGVTGTSWPVLARCPSPLNDLGALHDSRSFIWTRSLQGTSKSLCFPNRNRSFKYGNRVPISDGNLSQRPFKIRQCFETKWLQILCGFISLSVCDANRIPQLAKAHPEKPPATYCLFSPEDNRARSREDASAIREERQRVLHLFACQIA